MGNIEVRSYVGVTRNFEAVALVQRLFHVPKVIGLQASEVFSAVNMIDVCLVRFGSRMEELLLGCFEFCRRSSVRTGAGEQDQTLMVG